MGFLKWLPRKLLRHDINIIYKSFSLLFPIYEVSRCYTKASMTDSQELENSITVYMNPNQKPNVQESLGTCYWMNV